MCWNVTNSSHIEVGFVYELKLPFFTIVLFKPAVATGTMSLCICMRRITEGGIHLKFSTIAK